MDYEKAWKELYSWLCEQSREAGDKSEGFAAALGIGPNSTFWVGAGMGIAQVGVKMQEMEKEAAKKAPKK